MLDVLVIGGGPAGAAAAKTVALSGLHVMLVDDVVEHKPKVGESLPGAAKPLLHTLGLWPWMMRSEPLPNVGNLSAWGGTDMVSTDFIADPYGAGWHLDRPRFDHYLREAAVEAGADWRNARLQDIQRTEAGWKIMLSDGVVEARWVIDASGRAGVLARCLGIERSRDEPLAAVYTWGIDAANETRTVIEAVACGWWYSAPVPSGKRIIVLHVEPRQAARLLRHRNGWREELGQTQYIRQLCRLDTTWSRPQGTDAAGIRLKQVYGESWLAVGDAALAFEPLSSQGMFHALYTGLRGAQAVIHVLKNGDSSLLRQYSDQLEQVRAIYRQRINYYYSLEQRWRNQPFWRNRRVRGTG